MTTTENWDEIRVLLERAAAATYRETRGLLGSSGGRKTGFTADGDKLTAADDAALSVLERELRKFPLPVALFDEAHGTLRELASRAKITVIADELDGTRSHSAGMPTCAVSLAALPAGTKPTIANVQAGVIHTFENVSYSFVKGGGLFRNSQPWIPPSDSTKLNNAMIMFETINSASLPLLGILLAPFEPLVFNGILSIASSTYVATKLLEGSVHLHLHLGNLIWNTFPGFHKKMRRVYPAGAPGQHAYDIASGAPMLIEAGRATSFASPVGSDFKDLRLDQLAPFSQISASNQLLLEEAITIVADRLEWMKTHTNILKELLS